MNDCPPLISSIVSYYGPERVWNCSLQVLGFPATWTTTTNEADLLSDSLRKENV